MASRGRLGRPGNGLQSGQGSFAPPRVVVLPKSLPEVCRMSMRLGTAAWADPAFIDQNYPVSAGRCVAGQFGQQRGGAGLRRYRHVCLVSGSRSGKGASSIINNLCLWPGSVVVIDPKGGENATVTAARRGEGSPCSGLRGSLIRNRPDDREPTHCLPAGKEGRASRVLL